MSKRAVGIVRVSEVGERSGDAFASPVIQTNRIKAEIERQGAECVEIFEELDVSGGKPLAKRPGLSKALEMVETHQADLLIVAYLDRLCRSVKVQTELIERVEQAGGDIYTLDHGAITNATAAKRLEANIMGSIYAFYREQIGEKTLEANRLAVDRGVYPSPRIPLGYARGADGVLIIDPETRDLAVEAFRLKSVGTSYADIRSYLAANGIKRAYSGVVKMFKSRVYLGEVNFGQYVNEAAHEALIDAVTWQACQQSKAAPGRKSRDSLLTKLKLVRCANCGTVSVLNGKDHPTYRCPTNAVCDDRGSVSAANLEAHVADAVKVRLAGAQGHGSTADVYRKAQEALAASQERLDGLLAFYAATGTFAEPGAVEAVTAAREARDRAQAEADRTEPASGITIDAVEDWDLLSLDTQRQLVRALVAQIAVSSGRMTISEKVRIDFK